MVETHFPFLSHKFYGIFIFFSSFSMISEYLSFLLSQANHSFVSWWLSSFLRVLLFNSFFMFIYLFLRKKERANGEGADREFQVGSQHRAQCGLHPMNLEIMTQAKINSCMFKWLSHPGAPRILVFISFPSWHFILSHFHWIFPLAFLTYLSLS